MTIVDKTLLDPAIMRAPAGPVADGAIMGFDGIDGNKAKALTAAAATAQLNAFASTLKGLVPAPTAPDVAAGKVLAANGTWITGGGSSANEGIFALELADLRGSRLPLVGGIADAFDDQSGVGASTGYFYDAANDWFRGAMPATQEVPITGAITQVGTSIFTLATRVFALAPNETLKSIGVYCGSVGTQTVKIVRRISATQSEVIQTHDFTATVVGWNDFVLPTPYIVPATGTYHVACVLYPVTFYSVTAGNRQYATGNAPVGTGTWTDDTGSQIPLRANYLAQNMDLQSVAYNAAAQPTTAKLTIQTLEPTTIVMNTDVIGYVSRNNGATWQQVTFSPIATLLAGSPKMYESPDVDVSAMSAGTAMRWRIRTANNVDTILSGVVLQWK